MNASRPDDLDVSTSDGQLALGHGDDPTEDLERALSAQRLVALLRDLARRQQQHGTPGSRRGQH